jgi:hypothetical protein
LLATDPEDPCGGGVAVRDSGIAFDHDHPIGQFFQRGHAVNPLGDARQSMGRIVPVASAAPGHITGVLAFTLA